MINIMEFEHILAFFNGMSPLKHKYRILGSYIKHVKSIKTEEKQKKEVECMKKFLLANPNLKDRKLDNDLYPTSKGSVYLYLNSALDFASEEITETFWHNLIDLDAIIFPNGRPETLSTTASNVLGSDAAATVIANNPILGDVIDQIKGSAMELGPDADITTIMGNPAFGSMVKKIRNGLKNGKYKISDLTRTITDVAGTLDDNIDPETKEMFDTISDAMKATEKGETPDMKKLMSMANNFTSSMGTPPPEELIKSFNAVSIEEDDPKEN
jgi:hypothetical protein